MTATEWSYLVFGIVLIVAIIFDLGLLSKKSHTISIKAGFFSNRFLGESCIRLFCFCLV